MEYKAVMYLAKSKINKIDALEFLIGASKLISSEIILNGGRNIIIGNEIIENAKQIIEDLKNMIETEGGK